MLKPLLFITAFTVSTGLQADALEQSKGDFEDKFRQLNEVLPTPNTYRNAAGEPGHEYWQQQVDYKIDVSLDEDKRRISATEAINYHNNSPDTLKYLWMQLDQNRFKSDSMSEKTLVFGGMGIRGAGTKAAKGKEPAKISLEMLRKMQFMDDHKLGYDILSVTTKDGQPLKFTIIDTNMRIDLAEPLKPGQNTEFELKYAFNMLEENAVSARSGYEHFPKDARKGGNDIFLLAQWFPRLHAYTDYEAWTNRAFLGRGEFTLEFGNYEVSIDVPADHIVSATGALQNPNKVLTGEQRKRLKKAATAKMPVFVVTPEEALKNEETGSNKRKTWQFKAEKVRDFAWASSRKFIWDAKGYQQGGTEQPLVMAMSFYPKEGGELWQKYSTEAVIHTMEVYSRFAFDYPYPVAQSVNGPVGGMEYPMISFNGPRTKLRKDGSRTYSLAEKRYLISVVIHEVGHNYFPMIVNSDERQWAWMDESLNSFLDAIAGYEWDPNIPWGVTPRDITAFMQSDVQLPIMTQANSLLKAGSNAYHKPAAALTVLRETILGRELFDFAFREYAQRWKFKRPTPSDFFRTMEEASGVDLDWFWRGWFYSTDHVDISLDRVYKLRLDTEDPDIDFQRLRQHESHKPELISVTRNRQEGESWVERNPKVKDFYDEHDKFTVTNKERNKHQSYLKNLEPAERRALARAIKEDKHYYMLEFSNLGGLVMPILLELNYKDGSKQDMHIPAEIWRRNPKALSKLIVSDKELASLVIDPHRETADVDVENNHYPRQITPSRIKSYKSKRKGLDNRDIMHDIKTKAESGNSKE